MGRSRCSLPHEPVLNTMCGMDLQKLVGNGQHLFAMGAFIMYMMSNTILKTDAIFSPSPWPSSDEVQDCCFFLAYCF